MRASGDLAARAAIADVVHGYAHALDTKDWAGFRRLFTEDAVLDYSGAYGFVGGPAEITAWLRGLMTPEFVPATMHAMTNLRITVNGAEADVSAYGLNPNVMAGGADEPFLLLNAARYRMRLQCSSQGWLICALTEQAMFAHRGELTRFEVPDYSASTGVFSGHEVVGPEASG
jgi:hypothetical protein